MSKKLRMRSAGLGLGALLGIMASGVLLTGWVDSRDLASASRMTSYTPSGSPQLVAAQPLPAGTEGEMCQWLPASAAAEMLAAVQQPAASEPVKSEPVKSEEDTPGNLDRAPARVIRDTYPTYSAIAVDTNSNELYMQDENLYGYKVFNRLDNTPPNAAFTEPKRIVSGIATRMEYNCGLYVDPVSGDVYSVNNDTLNSMTVFPRSAEGNVKPMRELTTPHGSWGIAVEEASQELYLTVEHSNSVVVYRKMAQGDEKPLRTLAGDKTLLADPHGLALDPKNNLMYVANHGNAKTPGVVGSGRFLPPSITVYPLQSSGDTAPLRVIQGTKTQLNWPAAMSLDTESGDLYVANDSGDSLLVFRSTDNGDVAPARVVKGPRTGIKNPTGVFVDMKNREVWLSNMGNHRATVYPLTANGNVAPLRSVRSAPEDKLAQAIGNPGAVGYDTKREEILVPN
jgi:6-phosphogluconolactonase (cycloisomerase 2 family)